MVFSMSYRTKPPIHRSPLLQTCGGPPLQAWAVLEDGGHMAIHIVDINARVGAFTETMNLFIQGVVVGLCPLMWY